MCIARRRRWELLIGLVLVHVRKTAFDVLSISHVKIFEITLLCTETDHFQLKASWYSEP